MVFSNRVWKLSSALVGSLFPFSPSPSLCSFFESVALRFTRIYYSRVRARTCSGIEQASQIARKDVPIVTGALFPRIYAGSRDEARLYARKGRDSVRRKTHGRKLHGRTLDKRDHARAFLGGKSSAQFPRAFARRDERVDLNMRCWEIHQQRIRLGLGLGEGRVQNTQDIWIMHFRLSALHSKESFFWFSFHTCFMTKGPFKKCKIPNV